MVYIDSVDIVNFLLSQGYHINQCIAQSGSHYETKIDRVICYSVYAYPVYS